MSSNTTVHNIRADFPILQKTIHGHPLVYLDNAATTQKPQCVLDALNQYYSGMNANIHRGVHQLSTIATQAFENARASVQKFINAKHAKECIFVRGATEAINLVAASFGGKFVNSGDEILISAMEHHSNIVPWQMLCQTKGAHLKIIPMNKQGELNLETIGQLFNKKTKLLAITHASNALGTRNPLSEIIQSAHAHHVPVLVDGAQSAPHLKIDVQALDCDFFTFSSHKTYGPTGVGVLYGKTHLLEAMPPYQGGGEMILQVNFEKSTYNEIPFKFEAGTPAIAEVIAFGNALEYLERLGWDFITKHEKTLLQDATEKLSAFPGLKIIGTAKEKVGVISFTLDGVHPHDIGSILDQFGIAIRTGHHCAMPIMNFFNVPATARASFGIYNTIDDIDKLISGLHEVRRIFPSSALRAPSPVKQEKEK
ncbi:MAG TPA: cysteine desulfurase [Gammaproteobacteria bacterium]|nr:cysteine desulfurase [Gammaproteobacteria bacterium]HRA43170.1 cysteine desulfurase [Gammaproteobacteria bacterium]